MPDPKYTFRETDGDVYINYLAPCGDLLEEVAVIREIDGPNPILQLQQGKLFGGRAHFCGPIDVHGLMSIIAFLGERMDAEAWAKLTKKGVN